jgi:hypothetical protein
MKKQIPIFILIALGTFSCQNKQTSDTVRVNPSPQMASDGGHFQKGCYWIFKDSTCREVNPKFLE